MDAYSIFHGTAPAPAGMQQQQQQHLYSPLLPQQPAAAGHPVLGLPLVEQQAPQQMHLPATMSDLDLVAAVTEEVSVYDLHRTQELEHQQHAAAAAAASAACRVSEMAAGQAATSKPSTAGSLARRLSYQPPGTAAISAALPHSAGRSSSVSPTATPSPQPPQEAERRPVTAATALRQWSHLLTPCEQSEILSFSQVRCGGRCPRPQWGEGLRCCCAHVAGRPPLPLMPRTCLAALAGVVLRQARLWQDQGCAGQQGQGAQRPA